MKKVPVDFFLKPFFPLRSETGMALLLTITIITIVTAVAFDYNVKSRNALITSTTMSNRVKLTYVAESGIHAATALLMKDRADNESDSLQEDWANPEKLSALIAELPFDSGVLTLQINDEIGKIQVNALVQFPGGQAFNDLQQQLWGRFLFAVKSRLGTTEEMDPNTIISAIKDWIDFGDDDAITGINGAESGYYSNLTPAYTCRNRPLAHLGELTLVKGVSLKWLDSVGGAPAISDYLTVHGMSASDDNRFKYEGKININTASLAVLAALLPSGGIQFAKAIDEYRLEKSDSKYIHDLSDPKWYKKVPGLKSVDIDPKLITVASDVFRIESTAEMEGMQVSIVSILQRDKNRKTGKWEPKVLRRHVK